MSSDHFFQRDAGNIRANGSQSAAERIRSDLCDYSEYLGERPGIDCLEQISSHFNSIHFRITLVTPSVSLSCDTN